MRRQHSIMGELTLNHSRVSKNHQIFLEKIEEGFKVVKNSQTLLGILGLFSFTTEENKLKNTINNQNLYSKVSQLKNISYGYLNCFTQQNFPRILAIIEDLKKCNGTVQSLLQIINKHASILNILNILVRVHAIQYLKQSLHLYCSEMMGNEKQILQNMLVQPRNSILNIIVDSLSLQLQFRIGKKSLELFGKYCHNYIIIQYRNINSKTFLIFDIRKTELPDQLPKQKHKRKVSQGQPNNPKRVQKYLTGTNKEIPISQKQPEKLIVESPYLIRRKADAKSDCVFCNRATIHCKCSKNSKQQLNGNINQKILWKDYCYEANAHS